MWNDTSTLENNLSVSQKVKLTPTIWPTTDLRVKEISAHTKTYTYVHNSFICKPKQSRSPSRGEWINKLWDMHTMETILQ